MLLITHCTLIALDLDGARILENREILCSWTDLDLEYILCSLSSTYSLNLDLSQEVSIEGERYQNCLREIRSRACDVVDAKTGIVIKKKDWESLRLHIASKNNFPTAAGLASSAAGFACLGNDTSSYWLALKWIILNINGK